jgi:hypothetical protein
VHKQDRRLYNLIFPIWLLWLVPPVWLIALAGNFFLDLLVLSLTLKYLRAEDWGRQAKRLVWRSWIFGFLADLAGTAVLLPSQLLDGGEWYQNVQYAVAYDPFDGVWSFLWVTAGVLAAAVCIYFFNRKLVVKEAVLTESGKHMLALSMAVFTAPYLFYLPLKWFW